MSKIYLFLIAAMFSVSTFGQTTITFQPNSTVGKDAFVWDYNPNNNYGSTDEYTIYAWTYNGTPSIRRCLIDFDFSAIPSNAVITNAELILFNDPNSPSTNGEHSQLSGSNEMIVQRVINSWNEQSITWNNQPNVTTQNQIIVPASSSVHQNYNINVTSLVQDIINNPNSSFGFSLKLQTEAYYRSVIFTSSDAINSTLRPKIIITYTTDNCVTIQPNSTDGKDAFVWDYSPNNNYGSTDEYTIYAWTYNGTPSVRRCLIDFDYSTIPSNAVITNAELTLFNDPNSPSTNGEHSQLSGSNEMIVQRVITSWNEQSVTWNNQPNVTTQNQIIVPASFSVHQNYNINVTSLVQDIIDNPSSSFGFQLKLQTEAYYRSVIFASSDISDSNLYPKIEICYINKSGISINNILENIKIYPNPVQNILNIENLNIINKSINIEILNLYGAIIYSKELNNNVCIDFSKYSKGLYLIRITSENFIRNEKILKL